MLTKSERERIEAHDWTKARAGDDEPLEHGNGRPYTWKDGVEAATWGKVAA